MIRVVKQAPLIGTEVEYYEGERFELVHSGIVEKVLDRIDIYREGKVVVCITRPQRILEIELLTVEQAREVRNRKKEVLEDVIE